MLFLVAQSFPIESCSTNAASRQSSSSVDWRYVVPSYVGYWNVGSTCLARHCWPQNNEQSNRTIGCAISRSLYALMAYYPAPSCWRGFAECRLCDAAFRSDRLVYTPL